MITRTWIVRMFIAIMAVCGVLVVQESSANAAGAVGCEEVATKSTSTVKVFRVLKGFTYQCPIAVSGDVFADISPFADNFEAIKRENPTGLLACRIEEEESKFRYQYGMSLTEWRACKQGEVHFMPDDEIKLTLKPPAPPTGGAGVIDGVLQAKLDKSDSLTTLKDHVTAGSTVSTVLTGAIEKLNKYTTLTGCADRDCLEKALKGVLSEAQVKMVFPPKDGEGNGDGKPPAGKPSVSDATQITELKTALAKKQEWLYLTGGAAALLALIQILSWVFGALSTKSAGRRGLLS